MIQLGDMIPDAGKPGEMGFDFYRSALPYMGYDVAGVGELEIRATKMVDEQAVADLGVPLVCANVVREKDNKPLLGKPYIIKKLPSGLRVAVVAVVGENVLYTALQKDLGIRVLPPADVLRSSLDKIRKEADIVVVLAHVGYEGGVQLASQVPGIDVILSSHPSSVVKDFQRIGETVVMHCKSNCKHVGKLTLDISADGKITSVAGEQIPLNDKLAEDDEIAKLVERTDKRVQKYYRTFNAEQNARYGGNSAELAEFVGADRCAKCHGDTHKSWRKTEHAQAYDALKKDAAALKNPYCLSCHTTGFDMTSGFTKEAATPHLKSVQCESCHGAGSVHAQKPKESRYGAVSETTCLQCHDKGNSPDFNYEKYLPRVRHLGVQ